MNDPRSSRRNIAAIAAGLLPGLAVSFRLPNLVLSAGYFLILLALAARSTKSDDIVRLTSFETAFLMGLTPTLVSNVINARSILVTTYSSVVQLDGTEEPVNTKRHYDARNVGRTALWQNTSPALVLTAPQAGPLRRSPGAPTIRAPLTQMGDVVRGFLWN